MLTFSNKVIIKADRDLYQTDIIKSLSEAGVEAGDIVFVHSFTHTPFFEEFGSDVFTQSHTHTHGFGELGEIRNIEKYCNALIECFIEAVGSEGTVIMPTFTYSFFEGEKYSPCNSVSKAGIITEVFRTRKGAIRSLHPIYSIAAIGKKAKYHAKLEDKTCFGSKSFFAKLLKKDAKIIFFGAPFGSIIFLHFIEKSFGVPYCYSKKFSGTILTKDGESEDAFTCFVRPSDGSVVYDFSRLEDYFLKNGPMKMVPLGKGWVKCISSKSIYKECFKELSKNPQFFLKSW